MNIIIAGNGKIGATLTRQLTAEGHDLTLIDSNPDVLASSMDRYDVMAVHGNCASMEVLEQAGVRDADLLIAATSEDEVNLLCCLTAHGINPNLHTSARIRNPEYSRQIYQMRDTFALSMTVNPEFLAAMEIERLIKYPGFLKRDTFAKGRAELVELRIGKDSKLRDTRLIDLNNIVSSKVLVCVVLRDGSATIPDGSFVLREGDRIFVTAPTDELTILLKNLGILPRKNKRVLLCGGGRISYYLAHKLLDSGLDVRLIERDYQRCRLLAEQLPDACIIHGDASDQSLLESEGLTNCDALVSLTGLDEVNMVISLYANSCGIHQVITKLGHLESNGIVDNLPLGSIINPKELCGNLIVRYIRALKNQNGAAITVYKIADGQAEASEFRVDEHTRYCGVPLKQLRLRRNVLIACISSGAHTEVPNGNSSFQQGDTVIVVTNGHRIIYQLNDIFED